jgi:hypothetical protein
MVPRPSYTAFTLLIRSVGLCRVSDSGGPDFALPIPKPVSLMQLIVGDNQPAPLIYSPICNGIFRSAHDDDGDGIQAHSGRR